MKLIVLIMMLFLSLNSVAQNKIRQKHHYALTASFALLSGSSDGLRDAVLFHNDAVLKKLNVNAKFWGSDSYLNKYKNRDTKQGAKFPGSKSVFVFTTDAPHLLKFTNNLFTAGAIAVQFDSKKHNWKYYLLKGIGYWTINRIGFSLAYNHFK